MRPNRWKRIGRVVGLRSAVRCLGFVAAAAAVLSACGGGQASTTTPTPLPVVQAPSQLGAYHVFVTDLATGDVDALGVQTVHVSRSVHGLALSADRRTLYVSDVDGNRLHAFSLENARLSPVHTVPVGAQPVHMVAARDGRTVYVTNFQGASVSVVDTRSWTKTKDIAVPDRPFDAVLSPDGRFVYVACYGGAAVAVIDAASASLAGTVALPQGTQPYGIAISPDGRYVYASDNANGQLLVLDANARSYLRAVPIGAKPALIARSPDGATLYVAYGQVHSVSILDIGKDAAHPSIRASVDVGGGYPHGVAVTPDGRYVVVATTFGKHLAVIDVAAQKVVATVAAEEDPNDVLIAP